MARPTLSKHPKFLRLCASLRPLVHGLTAETCATGILEMLWGITYESGDPCIGSAGDVELFVGWGFGAPGDLVRALRDAGGHGKVGFLEEIDGGYHVHDLFDHCPDYVKKRRRREQERHVSGEELQAARKPKRLVPVADNGAPAPSKRGRPSRRCPAEFALTDDLRDVARGLGLKAEEIAGQFAKFKDQEFAKAHSDWPATWRNWCRNHLEWKGQRNNASGRPEKDPAKLEEYLQKEMALDRRS